MGLVPLKIIQVNTSVHVSHFLVVLDKGLELSGVEKSIRVGLV